jgi:hypothetical protein
MSSTSPPEERPSARNDGRGRATTRRSREIFQHPFVFGYIGALIHRAGQKRNSLPSFLDLGKSEILNLLRTKLW